MESFEKSSPVKNVFIFCSRVYFCVQVILMVYLMISGTVFLQRCYVDSGVIFITRTVQCKA
jgi:hypothetical protein